MATACGISLSFLTLREARVYVPEWLEMSQCFENLYWSGKKNEIFNILVPFPFDRVECSGQKDGECTQLTPSMIERGAQTWTAVTKENKLSGSNLHSK